jgi:hypothetical protein
MTSSRRLPASIGDRQGQPIANSYGFFNSDGSVGFESSFTYWTEIVPDPSNSFNMLAANGMNAPAPWVPYTTRVLAAILAP